MAEQLALISALETAARLDPATVKKAQHHVERLIALYAAALTREQAVQLPNSARSQLALALTSALTIADLKAVLKAWEPDRSTGRDATQTELAERAVAILNGSGT